MDEKDFKYIRNRIREFKKADLLNECYFFLESRKEVNFPIWSVFLIMKWTYLYAEQTYPYKKIERSYFVKLLKWTSELNQKHASSFIKNKKIDRAFLILNSQQLYLQRSIYNEIFATQIKLFETIKGKYDINNSFQSITGLSISDFLIVMKMFWIRIDSATFGGTPFYGYFEDYVLQLFKDITGCSVDLFVNILTLSEDDPKKDIDSFNKTIKNGELQILETTFFTMFPFQKFEGKLKLIHKNIFKYTANYYIYDFLKKHDEKFTTEFGSRIEKYVELGLKEIGYSYFTEKQLRQKLPPKSKVVDYHLDNLDVFIECKAVELQAYPS